MRSRGGDRSGVVGARAAPATTQWSQMSLDRCDRRTVPVTHVVMIKSQAAIGDDHNLCVTDQSELRISMYSGLRSPPASCLSRSAFRPLVVRAFRRNLSCVRIGKAVSVRLHLRTADPSISTLTRKVHVQTLFAHIAAPVDTTPHTSETPTSEADAGQPPLTSGTSGSPIRPRFG